ncbi:DUF6573 family protein [Streptomyces sp. CAS3]
MATTTHPASSTHAPAQEPAPAPAEAPAPTALPRNLVRLTFHAEAAGWAAGVERQPGHCALVLTARQRAGNTVLRCLWRLTARGYRWDGATLTRHGQTTTEGIAWRAVADLVAAEAPTAGTQPTAPGLPAPVHGNRDTSPGAAAVGAESPRGPEAGPTATAGVLSRIDSVLHGAAVTDDPDVSSDAMRSVPLADPHEIIHAYTRARALADGVLVAADAESAREAGLRLPVALTSAAWEDCVAWNDGDSARQVPQNERGRLWDVLTMTRTAIRRSGGNGRQVTVGLRRVPRDGRTRKARPAQLVCAIGPGDHGEPVLTIMEPDED